MTHWKWHWEFAVGMVVKPIHSCPVTPRPYEASSLSHENLMCSVSAGDLEIPAAWFQSTTVSGPRRCEDDSKPDVAARNQAGTAAGGPAKAVQPLPTAPPDHMPLA